MSMMRLRDIPFISFVPQYLFHFIYHIYAMQIIWKKFLLSIALLFLDIIFDNSNDITLSPFLKYIVY